MTMTIDIDLEPTITTNSGDLWQVVTNVLIEFGVFAGFNGDGDWTDATAVHDTCQDELRCFAGDYEGTDLADLAEMLIRRWDYYDELEVSIPLFAWFIDQLTAWAVEQAWQRTNGYAQPSEQVAQRLDALLQLVALRGVGTTDLGRLIAGVRAMLFSPAVIASLPVETARLLLIDPAELTDEVVAELRDALLAGRPFAPVADGRGVLVDTFGCDGVYDVTAALAPSGRNVLSVSVDFVGSLDAEDREALAAEAGR